MIPTKAALSSPHHIGVVDLVVGGGLQPAHAGGLVKGPSSTVCAGRAPPGTVPWCGGVEAGPSRSIVTRS